MTTQRPLRFSRGCWSLSISPLPSESVLQSQPYKIGASKAVALKLSVPKRVLKQAVRRNLAKRVARESWRTFKVNGLTEQLSSKSLLLRLSRRPSLLERPDHKLNKKHDEPKIVDKKLDSRSNVCETAIDVTSAKAAKAIMRADCDGLFEQLARYLGNRPNV
jgi:hypothetical protein